MAGQWGYSILLASGAILAMTCCVVAFSILVQGLSISTVVRRVTLSQRPPDNETQPLP
jgi:NhaP-type Na+/H+ or K+/H+ antiporter